MLYGEFYGVEDAYALFALFLHVDDSLCQLAYGLQHGGVAAVVLLQHEERVGERLLLLVRHDGLGIFPSHQPIIIGTYPGPSGHRLFHLVGERAESHVEGRRCLLELLRGEGAHGIEPLAEFLQELFVVDASVEGLVALHVFLREDEFGQVLYLAADVPVVGILNLLLHVVVYPGGHAGPFVVILPLAESGLADTIHHVIHGL